MTIRSYNAGANTEEKKADGFINIRGVKPKSGNDVIKLKGQGRVYFPLDAEDPVHQAMLKQAMENDGQLEITLVAEVRPNVQEEVDTANLVF